MNVGDIHLVLNCYKKLMSMHIIDCKKVNQLNFPLFILEPWHLNI